MGINSILYKKYIDNIAPELKKSLKLSSIMEVPKIEKIVINMGLGKAVNNKGIVKDALVELENITGQKCVTTYARKSQAAFKIRQGMPIGVKVTLRGQKMYSFLEKLLWVSLPRIRDFRGLKPKAFDGYGNYCLGVNEYIIFPEINLDKVSEMKGMDISIITSTLNDKHAFALLKELGTPFKKPNKEEN